MNNCVTTAAEVTVLVTSVLCPNEVFEDPLEDAAERKVLVTSVLCADEVFEDPLESTTHSWVDQDEEMVVSGFDGVDQDPLHVGAIVTSVIGGDGLGEDPLEAETSKPSYVTKGTATAISVFGAGGMGHDPLDVRSIVTSVVGGDGLGVDPLEMSSPKHSYDEWIATKTSFDSASEESQEPWKALA